jgi:hypothetical protein
MFLAASSSILYRFQPDLHLVMGTSKVGKPVRFRVTLDGKPLVRSHYSETLLHPHNLLTPARADWIRKDSSVSNLG